MAINTSIASTSSHKLLPQKTTNQPDEQTSFWSQEKLEPFLVIITLLAIITSLTLESIDASPKLVLLANITSYLAGGFYGVQEGIKSLFEKELNVDLLMVLAAGGAALVDQWHEGAILLFLFSLSNVLQAYALGRSRRAIKSLLDLRPDTAKVRRGEEIVELHVEDLNINDIVILQPGERVPIDGKVAKGTSTINQASITGESIPVFKQIGDDVFAGTLNENGTLDIEVTRLAADSTLARIIKLVETAQGHKAETQRFLDSFEQYYAMIVIAFTVFLIAIPPLLTTVDFETNFYRAMVVLVVASPCALIISTPASILSAIANGARKGILFKGGAHLESMATIQAVALDKTGTVTTGEPGVTQILPLNGLTDNELLQLVASVELRSEHPLAAAIVRAAQQRELEIHEPDDFQAIPGRGLSAVYNGCRVLVGTERLMMENSVTFAEDILSQKQTLESSGQSVLLVHHETDGFLGMIAIADTPRPEAIELVSQLHRVGVKHVVMLTGDNEHAASTIAKHAGFDEFHANLLPEQKVEKLKELQTKYGSVAMVGDGVNDAPALATATIGIAMGAAGTDVALETADVVLMSSELNKISYAIALSKRTRRIVWQNIAFSLGVIITLVIVALLPFINLPLPIGVVGHEGSTLIVVANGLRLLIYRPAGIAIH